MAITQLEREGVIIFKLDGRIIVPDVQELSDTVQNTLAGIEGGAQTCF